MAFRVVARVLIVNAAGELLLCRSRSGNAWIPPGGTLEEGETLAQAAVREALEEVGLDVVPGPMRYLKEFRPAGRLETVIEVFFMATAVADTPRGAIRQERLIAPAGGAERPWAGWWIQDVDGPRREVRWFTRPALAIVPEPVFPFILRDRFWEEEEPTSDPYLGLDDAK
ncbi:MAG TPA: NUDIX hydrolase [Symbiobacteriaceae bacterium]|jgi:ADP-ribose pyrophosphatase YjhB (NUDIX family)